MTRWLGRVRGGDPGIAAADAVRIARELCENEGLEWQEPVHVRRRRRTWIVWTNHGKIGGNIKIAVDAATGEARRLFGPLPR